MLGWRLIRDSEIALGRQLTETRVASLVAELQAERAYSKKCEALIEHERERIDAERERADRLADTVLQSNGLPAVSTTVRKEEAAIEAKAEVRRTDFAKELLEIYGETETELLEDGEIEPLPEPIAESISR